MLFPCLFSAWHSYNPELRGPVSWITSVESPSRYCRMISLLFSKGSPSLNQETCSGKGKPWTFIAISRAVCTFNLIGFGTCVNDGSSAVEELWISTRGPWLHYSPEKQFQSINTFARGYDCLNDFYCNVMIWVSFTQWCLVLSRVEIGPVVLEKKICKFLYPLENRRGPSVKKTRIPFTQRCFVPNLVEISPVVLQKKIVNFVKEFLQIVLILPGKGALSLTWTNLNPFQLGCFVPIFVEIGLVFLENTTKMWKFMTKMTKTMADRKIQILVRAFGSGEFKTCTSRYPQWNNGINKAVVQ